MWLEAMHLFETRLEPQARAHLNGAGQEMERIGRHRLLLERRLEGARRELETSQEAAGCACVCACVYGDRWLVIERRRSGDTIL